MATNSFYPIFCALRHVRDMGQLCGADLALLQSLVLRCNGEQASCWPSYEQLVLDTRYSKSALMRSATELTKGGFVSRKRRRNRSNIWFVNFAKLEELAKAEIARRKREKIDQTMLEASMTNDARPAFEKDESARDDEDDDFERDDEADDFEGNG